jgi:hypothetical protein
MTTQAIAEAVITRAASVSGVRGSSVGFPELLPPSPFVICGNHKAVMDVSGAFEVIVYTFPVQFFVERLGDDSETLSTLHDLIDGAIAAFRTGVTLSGTVAQTKIVRWNTDLYSEVGGSAFQHVEIFVEVRVASGHAYTA